MQSGFFLLRAVGVAVAVLCLTFLPLAGQATRDTAAKPALPRTADGHPDLQGIYDLSTLDEMIRFARPRQIVVLARKEDDLAGHAEVLQRAEPLFALLDRNAEIHIRM